MKNIYLLIACICGLIPFTGSAQTFTSVDIYSGADSSNPGNFVEYNNKLYFSATDGAHGYELWVSDGTQGGTNMVKDIWPGVGSSYPNYLTVCNGKLFFTATDSVHGSELWVSDGTAGGTALVKDIYTGTGSSAPYDLYSFNNKLIFAAEDSAHGTELWVSDGTTAGTTLVDDINTGTHGSYPAYYSGFYTFNNQVYFNAVDSAHGYELWVTDGTTSGTNLVADIYPGTGSSYPGYIDYGLAGFITVNNKMLFEASDSANSYQLWESDGTAGGTVMVADLFHGGAYPGYYGGFIVYNGKGYFEATDSVHGYELWATDGTAGGTTLVKDGYPGTGSSYPEFYALFNNKLYYNAEDTANNYQLWSSDGTTAGTNAVTNLYVGYETYAFNPWQITSFNDALFFTGNDSVLGYQLYSLNAMDSISMLAPAVATNNGPLNTNYPFYPFNGSLAFAASYNSIGNELWFYGPVPTGINPVKVLNGINVYPNPFTSQISLTGLQTGIEYELTLTDIQGRTIEQYQLTGTGATNTLHLPGTLASGMYLLQLSNGDLPGVTGQTGAAETVKIVKE